MPSRPAWARALSGEKAGGLAHPHSGLRDVGPRVVRLFVRLSATLFSPAFAPPVLHSRLIFMDLDDKPSRRAPQASTAAESRVAASTQDLSVRARRPCAPNAVAVPSQRLSRPRASAYPPSPVLHWAYRTNFMYYFNTGKLV